MAWFTEGASVPPALQQLGGDLPPAVASLLLAVLLLYLSIYVSLRGHRTAYKLLTLCALAAFVFCHYATPIRCGPVRSLQAFTSIARPVSNIPSSSPFANEARATVAIATMKLLDVFVRYDNFPKYTAGDPPTPALLALIILTELRYESFTPNQIRVKRDAENFSEPIQLAIHIGIFCVLQALPQTIPTILAYEVLVAIYVVWTILQQVLRYKTSPALFGPLYMADSLTGFWSGTWHNAFASPCATLAYLPVRNLLKRIGVPVAIAKALGVVAAFALMGAFHVYALVPIVPKRGLIRVMVFFVLNGVAAVGEAAIWGEQKHWVRAVLAWSFETALASWTVMALNIPAGLTNVRWETFCEWRTD